MRCWPTGPQVRLPDDEAGRFLTGLRRRVEPGRCAGGARLRRPSRRAFLGSAHIAGGELIADRLLSARSKWQGLRILTKACHDPPDPQHRHHRPRRPWQDHAGRPAAAPERHLPREREGRRARDGQQRPRDASAASPSWPRTARSSGRARTSTSSTRPATPTSAARSSACCRWSTACCCWSTRSKARCRRPASSPRRRWRWA